MIMSNDRKQFEIFTIMKKKANGNYYNILQQALKHFPTLLVYMKSIYLIYFAHMSIVCMCARFLRRIFFSRRAGSLSRGFFSITWTYSTCANLSETGTEVPNLYGEINR